MIVLLPELVFGVRGILSKMPKQVQEPFFAAFLRVIGYELQQLFSGVAFKIAEDIAEQIIFSGGN